MSMTDPQTPVDTGYAPINDLRMYYEIYGEGRPLILLHGAYMTIDTMGPILPGLAAMRQVIAAEQQGHGHTADIDRPITYEQMADDTAALLAHLEIGEADVFGFSMGGGIAAPTMILLGDSDGIRLEHAVELFKLLGGGVMGDLQGMPTSQLAVLPGTAHFVPPGHGLLDRADWVLELSLPFLDAPVPGGQNAS